MTVTKNLFGKPEPCQGAKASPLRAVLAAIALLAATATAAQPQVRENHEYARDVPVYADTLIAELTYPMAWGHGAVADFDAWRAQARQKVRECMLMPPRRADGFDVQVIGTERREGYTARKVSYRPNAYTRATAYLLVPDAPGPHPAVLVLHDHGGHLYIGKEKVVRPFGVSREVADDAEAWVAKLYGGCYVGDELARRGYVVLATDAPLWGERGRAEGVDRKKYDLIAGNMQMLGRDLSAWMTFDDLAAADLLASLPEVDSARVGCFGFSMGAYRSWMVAALSDRVSCAASVCWMVTTRAQLGSRNPRAENGGFANCLPGVRQWLDYPHIASMACPKPALFISGDRDKLFPAWGVADAFAEMRRAWASQGADSALTTELWPMGHECGPEVQQRVFQWLDEQLGSPRGRKD